MATSDPAQTAPRLACHWRQVLHSHAARPLRQAEVVQLALLEELGAEVRRRVLRLPPDPLWPDLRELVRADVVRVHDQEARLARPLVEVDAEEGEGELAAANHHRRALRLEMARQLPRVRGDVVPRRAAEEAALDAEGVLEVEAEVLRSEPRPLPQQPVRLLAAVVHQRLLDLVVAWVGVRRVALQPEPADDRLQRPVRAPPAVVVILVGAAGAGGLEVVVVFVLALHERDNAASQTRRSQPLVRVPEQVRQRDAAAAATECVASAQQRPVERQA
mmetsp:Transcript_9215/g.30606  ORF Transcript_9215/g.30606 Transcript_9215/m.30606 type:complete len:275 (-) Transcript_9215:477-1301(-)